MRGKLLPVLTVVLGMLALWYLAAIPMNVREALTAAERAGAVVEGGTAVERQQASALRLALLNPAVALEGAWTQDRPRLPAPHQVAAELWSSVAGHPPTSNRSLLRHAGITLGATVAGFVIGSLAGILLAVGIVHNRAMDLSVMPWAIVSQTIPIVALAPMIVVVLNSVGVQGLLPKAVISAYLSFFPVVVGMVKGLRTPDPMQVDLMRTWNASRAQAFWLLRLPSSVPYLFASLKVAVAAALVGTIVGELPVQRGGLGARMLAGSYYGQTTQIWAALLMAAALAAALVWLMGFLERRTLRAMGAPA
jgi:NitT/TauT family transport system permease protein